MEAEFIVNNVNKTSFEDEDESIVMSQAARQNETEMQSNEGTKVEEIEGNDQVYAISNAVSIIFIIIVVLVIFFWRKFQRNKKKLKKLTKEEVSKFLEGDSGNLDLGIDPESNLPFSMPYDKNNFEITLNDIEIDRNVLLGSGAYGMVYKGKLLNKETKNLPCAIKTLKPNADILYFRSLLSELKVMMFIGEHENIVKCLGACTAELNQRKLFIIVEYCALGNLESYLRLHRNDFENYQKDASLCNEYQNIKPKESLTVNVEIEEKRTSYSKYVNLSRGEPNQKLTVLELIRFGYEIVNAMDYLSMRKVVHGDLALRNVLLNEYMKVKLTDFGLSKTMINYSTYVKTATKNSPLPWRWLALETLKEQTFSTKSDVWSMGIVLWETFSLAQVPYPGLIYSQDFIRMLEKGLRMSCPSEFTPPEIYKMMIDCWHEVPLERPSFSELKEQLLELCLNYSSEL